MSLKDGFIALLLLFLIAFVCLRAFLAGIINYNLSDKAYKKRIKGTTIKQRLFYDKFRNEIPNVFFYLYILILVFHLIAIVCYIYFILNDVQISYCEFLVKKIVLYFDLTWLFLTTIMFYSPVKRVGNHLHFNKRGENIDYSRWITKTKNKKK